MDGASAIIAVVSLSIQLVHTVQKANKFLKEIQNAPAELKDLVDTLDELETFLLDVSRLIDRQKAISGLPGSVEHIERALKRCKATVTDLDTSVQTLEGNFARHGRLRKTWASIKTVVKKDHVELLRTQIESDMHKLHTAISVSMYSLQLHQIEKFSSSPAEDPPTQYQSLAVRPISGNSPSSTVLASSNANARLKTRNIEVWRYSTIFGVITVRKKIRYLEGKNLLPEQALDEESCLSFVPHMSSSTVELRLTEGFLQLPKSLSLFPVISDHDRFYEWCRPENIDAFKGALSRREVSPYSRNRWGESLLHMAVWHDNAELCSLLIQLGVDVDHIDDSGGKALHLISDGNCQVSTARIILSMTYDITLEDLDLSFSILDRESIEAAELLLSAYESQYDSNRGKYLFVSAALRGFGLRCGLGLEELQACVKRAISKIDLFQDVSDLQFKSHVRGRTLLDELFKNTGCPFAAARLAKDWLSMLAEAGYDIYNYLEKEQQIHAKDDCLTKNYWLYGFHPGERQLVFQLNDNPSVHWEWWSSAESPGRLVCHEFRNMNPAHEWWPTYRRTSAAWKKTWPFIYPVWAEMHIPGCVPFLRYRREGNRNDSGDGWKSWWKKSDNAEHRHARQARKKYPEHFKQPIEISAVPGAWVECDTDDS